MLYAPRFDAAEWFAYVDRKSRPGEEAQTITWCYAVPAMWQQLLQHGQQLPPQNRPDLRVLRSGAAALPHAVAVGLARLFPQSCVLPTYSMTECMPTCAPPLGYALHKPNSVGVPLIPLAIFDRNGGEDELPRGEVGEVTLTALSEAQAFEGYEDDAGAITPQPGGVYRTGDLGRMDSDGWVTLVGRSKEVINRGGELISPIEVEEVVLEHPQVDEVMAFSSPHDELGETVAIAVPAGESMLDLKELRKRPSKLSTLALYCWLRRRQCRLAEVVSFANAGGQLAGSAQPSFRRCSSLHQSCQGPMGLVSCSE